MKIPGTNFSVRPGYLAAGAVGALLAPIVIPVASNLILGLFYKSMKAGITAYDKSREFAAGAMDTFGEIVDEARAELDGKRKS